MKYDLQLTELKNLLPVAKNILIALPASADMDKLAAGLSLFLTLEAAGKQVSIVSDDAMLVSHTHLYGVDHVQKTLSQTEGGNLTVTLEGVAASDGTVPALEKLDWYAEGSNLNLVFHVLPGQTFQPARIVPRYQGGGFDLIFVVGTVNLNALGNIYLQNQSAFSGTHIVNIDIQASNSSFGQTNILDTGASSVSEMVANLIPDMGYALDADSASNILAGIFDATNNLQGPKVSADSYMAVANCLRVGGRKPADSGAQTASQIPAYDWSALIPKGPQPQAQNVPEFTVPPVISSANQPVQPQSNFTNQPTRNASASVAGGPSPEERPAGEGVISETVEPEWLTPKIFKGSSLG